MSARVRTVLIAVAFGLLATLGAAFYINSLQAKIDESGVKHPVFVAQKDISAGTPVADMVSSGLVKKVEIPQRYAVEGAIGDLESYNGRLLATPLTDGEQLTAAKFRSAKQSELAHALPSGKIALAVPVNEVVGVGGNIQAGDNIVILATFEPGPGGSDISRVLLKDIKVVSVAGDEKSGGMTSGATTKKTITVAVTPTEAEKLVFAEEKGKVWIGLSAAGETGLPETGGQTMQNIF
jgi:pilus assembly protein CpaB